MDSAEGAAGFSARMSGVNWPLTIAGGLALALAIGSGWCMEHVGSFHVMRWSWSCGAPPRAIASWSFTHHTRRPDERAELETWVARHARSVNAVYTASCQTPLHIAARFGREDLAAVLLAGEADANAKDKHGDRPLHLAAEYGHPRVTAVLLQGGADVDGPGAGGRTALHAAAFGLGGTSDPDGRVEAARLLLARGADVNAQTRGNGFTPLWYASASDNAAIAEFLRANGGRGPRESR